MRILYQTALLVVIFSCSPQNKQSENESMVIEELEQPDSYDQEDFEEDEFGLDNPVMMMYGADIAEMVNVYFKTGQWDKLYIFTDSASKASKSKKEIIELYKNLPLGFKIQGPLNMTSEDGITWLHYNAMIEATQKTFRFPTVIQNDTARTMLPLLVQQLELIHD